MKNQRRIFTLFFLISLLAISSSTLASPAIIPVTVDPRIELFSLIFRLAGNQEYIQCKIPSYAAEADSVFHDYRDHAVVELARLLRQNHGISYNAPMELALHVTDPPGLQERVPFDPLPVSLDNRWTTAEAGKFLVEARKFAKESDYMGFFTTHNDWFVQAQNRLSLLLASTDIVPWFAEYFGVRSPAEFRIELAMFNGGHSYGPSFIQPDGLIEFHSILGVWQVDAQNLPDFPEKVIHTIVHEFSHSFINPLVDDHEKALESAGQALYPLVAEKMKSKAYGNWQTMFYESLVRVMTIKWISDTAGEDKVSRHLEHQQRIGFYWISELFEVLAEYENNRDQYQTFEQFMPVVVGFFSDYAAVAEASIATLENEWTAEALEKGAKAPSVLSVNPPNGAVDVDTSCPAVIITFDRPMKDKSWSVMSTGQPIPEVAGMVSYNDDRTVLTIPVALVAGVSYGFALNSPTGGGFMDENGNELSEYLVSFRTRDE
ncbi:MAG: DUF4932 domain-containing protein [Gemmatimonadales bacterium]|nr:DUF4932 domain-containing protein [Gemmatimonadales bacterium]